MTDIPKSAIDAALTALCRTSEESGYFELRADRAEAVIEAMISAALPHIIGEPSVKVKPLEWARSGYGMHAGWYDIKDNGAHWGVDRYKLKLHSEVIGSYPTEEAATDAAQADHESTIKSALATDITQVYPAGGNTPPGWPDPLASPQDLWGRFAVKRLSMETAPKDGTRILIKTVTFGWNTDVCQNLATGDRWVEARWGKDIGGTETWVEWCGAERIHTTSSLTPIGWAPVPDDGQLIAAAPEPAAVSSEQAPHAPTTPADWPVTISELAGQLLCELGYGASPSMEPGADPRRDRIAAMIFAALRGQHLPQRVVDSEISSGCHQTPLPISECGQAPQAVVEQMAEALQPFAEFIGKVAPFWSDQRRIATLTLAFNDLTVGRFRAASAALAAYRSGKEADHARP